MMSCFFLHDAPAWQCEVAASPSLAAWGSGSRFTVALQLPLRALPRAGALGSRCQRGCSHLAHCQPAPRPGLFLWGRGFLGQATGCCAWPHARPTSGGTTLSLPTHPTWLLTKSQTPCEKVYFFCLFY